MRAVQGNRRSGNGSLPQADPHVAESRGCPLKVLPGWVALTLRGEEPEQCVYFRVHSMGGCTCAVRSSKDTPGNSVMPPGQGSYRWPGEKMFIGAVSARPSLGDRWVATTLQLSLLLLHH